MRPTSTGDMNRRLGGRWRGLLAGVVAALALAAGPGSASANVPFADIASSGPLDHVVIGNDLSCQAHFVTDSVASFYPPDTSPGDCGTFVSVDGTVYSPDFDNHDRTATSFSNPGWTPYTPAGQTPVTGSGTSADPFTVVTVVAAGDIAIRQTNTYVKGNRFFSTNMEVANDSGTTHSIVLYRGADCYLAESDFGYGFLNNATGGVFCSLNPNNNPKARVIGFTPLTPGATHIETAFTTLWSSINGSPFPNTVDAEVFQDNAAGIAWAFSLPPTGPLTRSGDTATASAGVSYAETTAVDPTGGSTCAGKPATIVGTSKKDKLVGTSGKDVIAAGGGKDKLIGKGNKDRLCGGGGRDVLKGGPGKDILRGGGKRDRCIGGGGNDRAKGCEREKSI